MTDLCSVGNRLPLTAPSLQDGPNFNVEGGVHSAMLGKFSLLVKEHFPSHFRHRVRMTETGAKSINEVVAENLAYWMANANMTQTALAAKAGVNQKTISNYLNPHQRVGSASGKEPSAKLSELDSIAKALAVEVWQLTREIPESERAMYEAIEKAYRELRDSARRR